MSSWQWVSFRRQGLGGQGEQSAQVPDVTRGRLAGQGVGQRKSTHILNWTPHQQSDVAAPKAGAGLPLSGPHVRPPFSSIKAAPCPKEGPSIPYQHIAQQSGFVQQCSIVELSASHSQGMFTAAWLAILPTVLSNNLGPPQSMQLSSQKGSLGQTQSD